MQQDAGEEHFASPGVTSTGTKQSRVPAKMLSMTRTRDEDSSNCPFAGSGSGMAAGRGPGAGGQVRGARHRLPASHGVPAALPGRRQPHHR